MPNCTRKAWSGEGVADGQVDSPRGMDVVGAPDAQVGRGRHAGLRVPVREAADGAALEGAAPHSRFRTAPRAGEAPVAAAEQRRPCRSPPDGRPVPQGADQPRGVRPHVGETPQGSRPHSLRSLPWFSAFPPRHGGVGRGMEVGGPCP